MYGTSALGGFSPEKLNREAYDPVAYVWGASAEAALVQIAYKGIGRAYAYAYCIWSP